MDKKTIKAAESILSRGDRVELIPVKDGDDIIHNHDCEKDCALFEKCKIRYLDGDVIKCMHFGNEKNFEGLKK